MSLLGLLAVLALAVAPGANAQSSSPSAAEFCREIDEMGRLAVTRGECVNIVTGPASENANNFIAGVCGFDLVQEFLGVSNKGECIKVVKDQRG